MADARIVNRTATPDGEWIEIDIDGRRVEVVACLTPAERLHLIAAHAEQERVRQRRDA